MPRARRSAPAQAIIAPLSVQSAGGGTISTVPAAMATRLSARRIAWLAATPPAATSAVGPPRALVAAGGVAANRAIRESLHDVATKAGTTLIMPPPALCTDNGAMIAWAGAERLAAGLVDTMDAAPRARWLLDANAAAPAGFAKTRAGF